MKQDLQLVFSLLIISWGGVAQPRDGTVGRSRESLLRSLDDSGMGEGQRAALNHQLATIYHAQGRWSAAELHYRSAIRLWKTGRNEAGRIQSTRNLAALYLDSGQRGKARDLGLDRIAARLDPASIEFAGVTGVIGFIHHAFGRYREAERRYVASVSAFERVAPDSAECLQVLNNLALLLHQTGRNSEALNLYERALARAASAGLRSEQVSLLANLGALKFTLDDPDAALLFYQQALDLAQTALGPQHPTMVRLFENCSAVLRRLKRNQEAREMDGRAEAIRAAYAFTIDVQGLSGGSSHFPRRR